MQRRCGSPSSELILSPDSKVERCDCDQCSWLPRCQIELDPISPKDGAKNRRCPINNALSPSVWRGRCPREGHNEP